jgi:hypothetical protein
MIEYPVLIVSKGSSWSKTQARQPSPKQAEEHASPQPQSKTYPANQRRSQMCNKSRMETKMTTERPTWLVTIRMFP